MNHFVRVFSPKIVGGKNCQNSFPAILRRETKVPIAIKLGRGEGKGINGNAFKKKKNCGFAKSEKKS